MKIEATKIYDFAKRLRYSPNSNLPDTIIVDHVNKEYNIKALPYNILFDIIFWNTPKFVYNIVKSSFKNQYNCDINMSNLIDIIKNLKLDIKPSKYSSSSIYTILHPCVDISLRSNFIKVIDILLSKVFNAEDSYFNTNIKYLPEININKCFVKHNDFVYRANRSNMILSGSIALANYGSIYRAGIKDFDFVISDKYLPKEVYDIVNREITYNNIVGKDTVKTEKEVKNIFENSKEYKTINSNFDNKLNLISAVIDRVAEYDSITKVTFILSYEDIEFDLIFKHDINCKTINIENTTIKVEDINDLLYAKKILGRPKDFQDLINFKPYNKLNNNFKCVINYEQ